MVRPTFNPSESESSGGLSGNLERESHGVRERAFGRRPQDGRRCHSKYFVSVSLCRKRGPPPTLSSEIRQGGPARGKRVHTFRLSHIATREGRRLRRPPLPLKIFCLCLTLPQERAAAYFVFGDPAGRAGQGKESPYLPWVVCACPESSGVSSLSGNLEREANTV